MGITTPGAHFILSPGDQTQVLRGYFIERSPRPLLPPLVLPALSYPDHLLRDLCRCPLYLGCSSRPASVNSLGSSRPLGHSAVVFRVNVLPRLSHAAPQPSLSNSAWCAPSAGACFLCLSPGTFVSSVLRTGLGVQRDYDKFRTCGWVC